MKFHNLGAAVILAVLTAGPAGAKDGPAGGSFRIMAHFDTAQTAVEQGGVSISSGASKGIVVVFDGTAEPFRFRVFDSMTVLLTKRAEDSLSVEGYSVRKDADGDEWYSRLKRVRGAQQQGTEGRYELVGGTGKYSGLTGTCAYGVSNISRDRGVTMGSCTWRIE